MSALPAELSTGMVHGRFIVAMIDGDDTDQEPEAIPASGKIVFKASVPYVPVPVTSEGPVTVLKGPITGVLDSDGYLCTPHPVTSEPMYRGVKLLATDDPDMAVTDWTWAAEYRLDSVGAVTLAISAHSFALPSGSELDLTTLVKVPTSPGYGLPQAEGAALRAEQAASESALSAQESSASASAAQASAEIMEVANDQSMSAVASNPESEFLSHLSETIDDRATLFNELAVNVKRYGALGNGVADDTLAIQAAEAVANTGRTRPLYFPNGTYPFSHTMTAKTVVGENRQKTRLRYTGTGSAVDNGGEIAYHRRWEHLTLVGTGVGIGLNLFKSPAGSYRNMLVEQFETGIYLDDGMSLYNLFDDVTVDTTTTGVKIDGLAHESRFKNFRINFAQIGFDVMGAGRTVIDSSSIENCTLYGVVIRDRGAGRNVATTMFSTRFEFNPVNIRIEPNVTKTAIIACHPVGGIIEDLGIDTIQINTNGNIITSGAVTTTGTVKGENVEATALKGDRVQARSSFNDARIQLVGTGTVIDRNVTGGGTALRVNLVNETATGAVLDIQRKSSTVVRVTNSGHLAVSASAAPPDASIVTGEAAFWIDTTNGSAKLMVKAKQADGTVKSGSIPLS